MKDEEKYIIYDYQSRSNVVSDAVFDAISYSYEKSYPHPDKTFKEICQDIHKAAEEAGHGNDENYRITYCDKKYTWPYDFYYIPDKVLRRIWDNRKEANNVSEHWRDNMQLLIDFLYDKPGFRDVYKDDRRDYEDIPLIKDVIGDDAASKLKEILESYRDTYRWGLREVNHFGWGFLATPTSNKETVVKAWKEAFNKDIEIPDDSFWIDIYEKDDMEYNEENVTDEEAEDEHTEV